MVLPPITSAVFLIAKIKVKWRGLEDYLTGNLTGL
jgi:hypothetical protein